MYNSYTKEVQDKKQNRSGCINVFLFLTATTIVTLLLLFISYLNFKEDYINLSITVAITIIVSIPIVIIVIRNKNKKDHVEATNNNGPIGPPPIPILSEPKQMLPPPIPKAINTDGIEIEESKFNVLVKYTEKEKYKTLAINYDGIYEGNIKVFNLAEDCSIVEKGDNIVKIVLYWTNGKAISHTIIKSKYKGIIKFLTQEYVFDEKFARLYNIENIEDQLSFGIDRFIENADKEQSDIDAEILRKIQEEKEKEEIRKRLLERQRKRDLEKMVLNEMIDEGLVFPDSNKRPPIPKDIVDIIWSRDEGKCVYCGSNENIHIDHIIPFSKGGATNVENLQLLCQKCNLQKSNKIG